VPYYLHRVREEPTVTTRRPATAEPKTADPDTCDRVYSALLGKLPLSPDDWEGNRVRGLTDEDLEKVGYGTLSSGRAIRLSAWPGTGGCSSRSGTPGVGSSRSRSVGRTAKGAARPPRGGRT
jgi:hypothetical protein